MAYKVKIRPDARAVYLRTLKRPPGVGYTRDEHRYKHVIHHLTLEDFVILVDDEIQGAVKDYSAVLTPEGLKDHHGQPVASPVMVVPDESIDDSVREEVEVELPVELPTPPVRLLIVRLLTPWVDGFCAYKRPWVYGGARGKQTECPYCGGRISYHSQWPSAGEHFHVCDGCTARFITEDLSDAAQDHE